MRSDIEKLNKSLREFLPQEVYQALQDLYIPRTDAAAEVEKYKKGLIMFAASQVDDIEINGKFIDVSKLLFEVGYAYEQHKNEQEQPE